MKYLILTLLLMVGCNTPQPIVTVCRHETLAQYASAVEDYGVENVQIIRLKYLGGGNKPNHRQVRVWHKGQWWYLYNTPHLYHFGRYKTENTIIIDVIKKVEIKYIKEKK